MKKTLIFFIISSLVAGCTARPIGKGNDFRYNSVVGDDIYVDEHRVVIKVVNVSDSIYDVWAHPSGKTKCDYLNQCDYLSHYSRLRRGAEIILKKIGAGKEIIMLDDIKPTGWSYMYMRFKVTEKK